MATASTVKLSPSQPPELYWNLREDSAAAASELLQRNHEEHHIFFNHSGFHNHIAHQLLTTWAMGASPTDLQAQYDHNKSYQRPPVGVQESAIADMHDPAKFATYLGKDSAYHDFLLFFQAEMAEKGWENVLNEYVFAGDARADDMLVRMFGGILHPIIHLGFGVEFQQPAIIAEALAQAAVHGDSLAPLLLGPEEVARKAGAAPSKSLVELIDAIRADEKIATAARFSDKNKFDDGILGRACKEMASISAQYHASPDDLEFRTAELHNAAAYFTGAAQHPGKEVRFDFYYIHSVNANVFFSVLVKQPWLSQANKARLVTWKGRLDLAVYASRGCPEPRLDEITQYAPKKPEQGWDGIAARAAVYGDDGHAAKLVRAMAHGERVCEMWGEREEFRVRGAMWLQLGHMAIDSVEAGDPRWVRNCGFGEAWETVPERKGARL